MRVWDLETPITNTTAAHVFPVNIAPGALDAGITSVAFSPDGQYVVAGCLDWRVRIWDVRTGGEVQTLDGHTDSVYSVAWMPDGKSIISGSLDMSMRFWDTTPLKEGREIVCTRTHKGHKVSFSM